MAIYASFYGLPAVSSSSAGSAAQDSSQEILRASVCIVRCAELVIGLDLLRNIIFYTVQLLLRLLVLL